MTRKCRNTPLGVARQLRQEANLGCALCGCPIPENAHIIPYEKTRAFPPEDMVALCPTCHVRADKGKYSEKYLRHVKANPHNRVHVKDAFLLEENELRVHLGTNTYIETPRLISVNDFDIIKIHKENNNCPLLNVSFFDTRNNLIGMIVDNYWHVDRSLVWDINYKPQHLVIRNTPKEISLDVKIVKGEVFILGSFYYMAIPIIVKKDKIFMGGNN